MTKRAPGSKFGIPSPPLLLAVSQVLLHRVMTSPLGHGVWDALVILTRGSTLRITTWKTHQPDRAHDITPSDASSCRLSRPHRPLDGSRTHPTSMKTSLPPLSVVTVKSWRDSPILPLIRQHVMTYVAATDPHNHPDRHLNHRMLEAARPVTFVVYDR